MTVEAWPKRGGERGSCTTGKGEECGWRALRKKSVPFKYVF